MNADEARLVLAALREKLRQDAHASGSREASRAADAIDALLAESSRLRHRAEVAEAVVHDQQERAERDAVEIERLRQELTLRRAANNR